MKVSYNGLWILIILVYSHTLYTSLSILHCPQVGDSNGSKKTVSYVTVVSIDIRKLMMFHRYGLLMEQWNASLEVMQHWQHLLLSF